MASLAQSGGTHLGHLLYSLVLELKPRREAALEPTQGYHAYALLLQVLQWRDPELSRQLHEVAGPKPFTLSPLRGRMARQGSGVLVFPEETYWLRLTVLSADLFARMLDALAQAPTDRDLRLESGSFRLQRIVTAPGQSAWAGFSSFEKLVAEGRPESKLRLAFHSPTAFRSGGRNVVVPLPGLVFGSLLARWNEFAPTPLPETLRQVAEAGVLVARYRLETRMLDFGRHREVGFEGECEYEVTQEVPPEAAAQLSTLAAFAYYAGVGAKTSMGMGQATSAGTSQALQPGRRDHTRPARDAAARPRLAEAEPGPSFEEVR